MTQIYLHGLGQTPTAWENTVMGLDSAESIVCPNLSDLLQGKETTYLNLYSAFSNICDGSDEELDLCGLLPFIDNWATCDQLSPKAFKKEPEKLLSYICTWIRSDRVYTVRFAIGMLMEHFLGERFHSKYADMVAAIRSDEYYINMMVAWYFATALAKQYASILPFQ